MKLFLDDYRDPYKTKHIELPLGPWTIARNFSEFCNTIEQHLEETGELPTFIAFDHDLSFEDAGGFEASKLYEDYIPKEKTGLHCVEWLIDLCIDNQLEFPNYICHTLNERGKERMHKAITKLKSDWY